MRHDYLRAEGREYVMVKVPRGLHRELVQSAAASGETLHGRALRLLIAGLPHVTPPPRPPCDARLHLSLPPDLYDAITQQAAEAGVSRSELMRQAIAYALEDA